MTEEHTYRVLVRGRFTELDDEGRARLRAVAGEHDMLAAGFTEAGSLAYDHALDFFSFRVELPAEAEKAACERGKARAAAAVDGLGVDFRDLKASATDMDLIKVRRRR
ncbi:DUF6204 family protein [Actinophytocola glycyrrhizae]|uniref:DUF6204 family protein n=1 Tax=Actinophytocola glycyrrhizae TaxID=2044873 RepID=A0ABV9SC81_9PSEU